jgi:uncharacterized protein (DUF2249 family)/quercetin dioxygenase-like cupin family protein
VADDAADNERGRKDGLDGVGSAKDQSTDPEPDPQGDVGAQNLSGASRKDMASTVPSHTNVTAVATASTGVMNRPLSCSVHGSHALSWCASDAARWKRQTSARLSRPRKESDHIRHVSSQNQQLYKLGPTKGTPVPDQELDVRALRKPDQHPAIFQAYDALSIGESFVLVHNHDPKHLHKEFDTDHTGSYGWEYLDKGPDAWRIRISKLATTPLPRVLCSTTAVVRDSRSDATGAVWKLQIRRRDLDSNIIRLQPAATIGAHVGPDFDVLLLVFDGTGQITTELDTIDLHPGALVWLPQRSQRQFTAGPQGLSYLTVHQRRQSLILNAAPPQEQ